MRLPSHAALLASGVQGGHLPAGDNGVVLFVIAVLGAVGAFIVLRLLNAPPQDERTLAENRPLAAMRELCPHGWRAEITLYGAGAPMPDDAPATRLPPVELEWVRYDDAGSRASPTRHMWARSLPEALQLMVDDRNAEQVLEELDEWPVE